MLTGNALKIFIRPTEITNIGAILADAYRELGPVALSEVLLQPN